jgi:hypothetical protein
MAKALIRWVYIIQSEVLITLQALFDPKTPGFVDKLALAVPSPLC